MRPAMQQIEEMAPDEKSLQAARQSMAARHWGLLGLNKEALFGHYHGSANYEVAIDLTDLAHRCNCPSRKRPCRHALALLMLLATQPDVVPSAEPPETVRSWLEKRRQREQSSSSPSAAKEEPVDPEARRKRAARRESRVRKGIGQLEEWLSDIIRNGLAGLETREFSFWEDQAKRLGDAQASGLANRVRACGEILHTSPDWPRRLLMALGRLQLLLTAYQRVEQLPESLQLEIRQLLGWSFSLPELEASGERVSDTWRILGQVEEDEDRFRMQRTWLQGRDSQQSALVLQFAAGRQGFEQTLLPGTEFNGTLLFYPGVLKRRARIMDGINDAAIWSGELSGKTTCEEFLLEYAEQLAQQPWLTNSLFVLKQATVSNFQARWSLRDSIGLGVPLLHREPWRILAATGGQPADFIFEWNGSGALPLGMCLAGRFVSI